MEPATDRADLGIQVHDTGRRVIVRVTGEIDLSTAPRLATELDRQLALGRRSVEVDLHGVTFLAAAGLTVLVRADRRYRDDSAQLLVTGSTRAARRTIALTGVERVLTIR